MVEENHLMSDISENWTQFGTAKGNPPQFDVDVAPGTRHYTLLNTNEPPEESELTFIQSVISEADARLACLDDEISKLQETLKRLEEERTSVLSYRTRNKVILSPLRRIPPEVLADIFSWTLPSLNDEWDRRRFEVVYSPWVLTWTSARWRVVSVSTPSLWSQVAIDYSSSRDPSSYPLSQIEAQIQRAQNLKIHFYGATTVDSCPQVQIFQLLSQHSSRWEELSIRLTPSLVPLLPALRGRIQLLKRLWVEWDGLESQAEVQSIDCFQSASSLMDFAVYNDTDRVIQFALPTHQLTRYDVDAPWAVHKHILKAAPHLVEARIIIRFGDEPSPDVHEIIDLSRLRRLYLSDTDVLNYLRSPSLEGLSLAFQQNRADELDILLFLESFLSRSACPLQRLSVGGVPDAHVTTKILQKISSITEFAIFIDDCDDSEETNLLMSTLAFSQVPGTATVAPQLRCVFVGCQARSNFDFTVYLEMLESRWGAEHCPLNAAVLATDGPGPDSATLRGLHALRQQGLDLLLLAGQDACDEMRGWDYGTTWN